MNNKFEQIKSKIINKKSAIVTIILACISIIWFIVGISIEKLNLALLGLWLAFVIGVFYRFKDIKNRMYYLMFFIVVFVFILSRPTILMFRGIEWWYCGLENAKWALISIYISIVGLILGEILANKVIIKRRKSKNLNLQEENIYDRKIKNGFIKDNINIVRKISFVMFVITFFAKMIVEVNKYIFMFKKNYAEYYILYQNNLPIIITTLASMIFAFLVIYLITNPSKKMSLLVLIMYIITNIPMLLIGERGSIVVAIIFSYIYIWYRNSKSGNEIWITKKEKILVCIMIPIGIMGLSIYNYTRSDEKIPSYNPINIVTDFFYKQGVSFDVLCIGHGSLDKLPNREEKNYTFGGFIDYIKYNRISAKVFNIEEIPEGNNIKRATQTNSFAHAMSYVAKEDYLDGHRVGVIVFVRNIC